MILDCTSIRTGGGVQVLLSFLNSLDLNQIKSLDIIVHSDFNNLNHGFSLNEFKSVYIISNKFDLFLLNLKIFFKKEKVFQLFGPSFLFLPFSYKFCGFANPWIAYPNSVAYTIQPFLPRLLLKLKYKILEVIFFINTNELHVENRILFKALKNTLLSQKKIVYVSNAISSSFKSTVSPGFVSKFTSIVDDDILYFSYISSDYLHKQLDLIPVLCSRYESKYSVSLKCFVTLPDSVYKKKSELFRKYTVNLGYIKPCECKYVLEFVKFAYFPTLLECFSAGFIEPLFTKTPLIVSDFDFVRSVLGDLPLYIDPLNIDDHVLKVKYVLDGSFNYNNSVSELLELYSSDNNRNDIFKKFFFN